MKHIFTKILILFVSLSFLAFAVKKGEAGIKKEIISMQRGACFGACPQYKIIIYKDGSMHYEGKRNVEKIGTFQKKLSKTELNKLIKAFRNAKFFDLKEEYASRYADLPETKISFCDKGKYKEIKDVTDAPEKLKQLEQLIDSVAQANGWTKIEEPKN